jgi:protein-S-isoprenylcysteine O-methyltransferase Ste14
MTGGLVLFAGVLRMYMAAAALVEERDLVDLFGEKYRSYQRRVPMFVPGIAASREAADDEPDLAESTS